MSLLVGMMVMVGPREKPGSRPDNVLRTPGMSMSGVATSRKMMSRKMMSSKGSTKVGRALKGQSMLTAGVGALRGAGLCVEDGLPAMERLLPDVRLPA